VPVATGAWQRYGHEAILIGFTTHSGTVTAAVEWGGAAERKQVRPALAGSYEKVFHDTGLDRFLLLMPKGSHASKVMETFPSGI